MKSRMDSTDFYQIANNVTAKPVDPVIHTFIIGSVFGLNLALLLMTVARVMKWCSDPLAGKLRDRISDLEEENDAHLRSIRDLDDQVEELEVQIEDLKEELDAEKEENGELCDLINELTNDITSYRKKNKSLREKVADLREIARIHREVDPDSDESPHKRRRVDDDSK